jgi:nucleoside-diphosphate-sugar epimerase
MDSVQSPRSDYLTKLKKMQTILGAGGAVGTHLARALKEYTANIRLVSRNPVQVNPSDELVAADLLDPAELKKAVAGSSVVYVTVGFPYRYRIWKDSWPMFTRNLLDACREHKCKLVFFDNIYMYDPDYLNGMTEDTPINPPSKKGKVRAGIHEMIMKEVLEGRIEALIARSADFYGPGIKNASMLTETVLDPLSKGKKANWMGSLKFKHSFTYTPDAGKATALLGNTPSAYGQVWHMPTAEDPPTGREWIDAIARKMGVKARSQAATRPVVRILGLFSPIMRELVEMMYQYERDYVFNSDKFEKHFSMKATPYTEGIKEIIRSDYTSSTRL